MFCFKYKIVLGSIFWGLQMCDATFGHKTYKWIDVLQIDEVIQETSFSNHSL